MKDPEWLLNSKPREVQKEALRRSYAGFKTRDTIREPARPVSLRHGPARGWSHYLEMRLGKSAVLLAEFELYHRDHDVDVLVIVCPNTFKGGWMKEGRDSGSLATFVRFDTSKWKQAYEEASKATGQLVIVINYESLRSDKAKRFLAHYTRGRRYGLGIDESIKIKSHRSIQTKAVLELAKDAYFVRNLSGKAVTQGPQDLYPQFRAIGEFSGKTFWAFRNRFCKMGGYKNKVIVGAQNEDELRCHLNRTSFIAKKRDWGTPGEYMHSIERVEITPKQAKYYKEMDDEFVTLLDSGEEITADVVITKMQKLIQISSGFIYHEGKAVHFEEPENLPKMQRLMGIMEEVQGKIVVCYHYSASGDALIRALDDYQPAIIRSQQWMKMNKLDVEEEKRRFNEDADCRVMIAQISASKYGHTLIGNEQDRCATMAFYENTYSLDDRSQVEMRNTYFEQDWVNMYLDFVGTKAEENMAKALAKKENVAESILDAYRAQKSPDAA